MYAYFFQNSTSSFSDFIWPFLRPYMGVIPNPKMAFIFPISCILALIFPILIKYFPKCVGKGSFPKSQIKSLSFENSVYPGQLTFDKASFSGSTLFSSTKWILIVIYLMSVYYRNLTCFNCWQSYILSKFNVSQCGWLLTNHWLRASFPLIHSRRGLHCHLSPFKEILELRSVNACAGKGGI